jgi:hypothetical protein
VPLKVRVRVRVTCFVCCAMLCCLCVALGCLLLYSLSCLAWFLLIYLDPVLPCSDLPAVVCVRIWYACDNLLLSLLPQKRFQAWAEGCMPRKRQKKIVAGASDQDEDQFLEEQKKKNEAIQERFTRMDPKDVSSK